MNKSWINWVTALLLTVLLPWLLCNTMMMLDNSKPIIKEPTTAELQTDPSAVQIMIRVLFEDGSVKELELEEYLSGVVAGEMPDEFETEALKAQAVVARTYTLRMRSRSRKHADADVCVRSDCCQNYRSDASERICNAVAVTAGQVLTYEGELIEATYFSSAGGRTEDALAVWGSDVPYLQSTDSMEHGLSGQDPYTVTMGADEFEQALGIELQGPSEAWIGKVTYTSGGGVDTMVIGDRSFKGTELRKLLGLRSTSMIVTAVGEHITITTRGHGHRVGMSQYGAEAMALDGATYDVILAHYYKGTTLELFVDKESGMG